MGGVLLTDAQQRKTLAAVRSLGSKGIQALAAEETRWTPAGFSRYCQGGLVYPSPGKKPAEFYQWLQETLPAYGCDVLFPMDDSSLEVVMQHKEDLAKLCRLPVPHLDSYRTASDKALAVAAAREAGLDCPATVAPEKADDLSEVTSKFNFPVLIKPRKSSGSRGMTAVERPEDLESRYWHVHQQYPWPIIQEYLPPGEKYDVCLLYNRSAELRASFVQREIRFFPLERGPSTVQESVRHPELAAQAAHLLQKLGWCGVAEVEFMVDPRDGKAKFMEINPRFWGSLYMSTLAGVDFPWLLYRLAMDGDVAGVDTYTVGIKCRWMLPGDILHFLANKKRFSLDPPFFSTKKSGVYDDIISLDDPFPVMGFFLACLRYLPDREMWKTMFQR